MRDVQVYRRVDERKEQLKRNMRLRVSSVKRVDR